jgi:hypothetical protein
MKTQLNRPFLPWLSCTIKHETPKNLWKNWQLHTQHAL